MIVKLFFPDTPHQLLKAPADFPSPTGAVDPGGKRRDDGQKILNELLVSLFRFFRCDHFDGHAAVSEMSFKIIKTKPRQAVGKFN
ncbi:hypothetical protein [Hydrogenibacillus schlegelii]|uniref:hypothetical protein n=1 Tax=Hydrogenibacillus schlegelii TaxID=1484 RepID=UPI002357125E|nr:hypothetical protein [Hydrogenibacillus schlegelii]